MSRILASGKAHQGLTNPSPSLNGFYNGIQTLVPLKEWKPENAWQPVEPPSPILKVSGDLRSTETSTPGLRRHNPYPAYTSTAYLKEFEEVEQCYLDARDTILPPDIFAYSGIPPVSYTHLTLPTKRIV